MRVFCQPLEGQYWEGRLYKNPYLRLPRFKLPNFITNFNWGWGTNEDLKCMYQQRLLLFPFPPNKLFLPQITTLISTADTLSPRADSQSCQTVQIVTESMPLLIPHPTKV